MRRAKRRVGPTSAKTPNSREIPPASRKVTVAFYLLAFMSGIAALIYEITWARMLSLTFGSTMLATAAVIAAFLGGMGVGARAYHLVYKRVRSPVLVYAGLEIGIALSAAVLTRTFYSLPELFATAFRMVPAGLGLELFQFAFVFILLLIPSALMGATFPALCTVMIRTVKGVDRHLGMIYGINTIGGAMGVLLAGLVLIERLGLTATVNVATCFNVAVGLAALVLVGSPLGRGDARSTPADRTAIPTYLPRRLTGLVLFVSGCLTLSYEILWFRALRYTVGNSTYALTTVFFIFLAGLGLGSLLLRRVTLRKSPERDLALCQLAIGVLALFAVACHFVILAVPGLADHVSIYSQTVRSQPWWWRLLVDGAIAAVVMLPATLFMGLSFPLASRLYLGDVKRLSTRVGGAYLLANLGCIVGSILGALVLLPYFGTIGGTKVAALANLALGLTVMLWIRKRATRLLSRAVAAVVPVCVLAIVLPSALTLRGELIDNAEGEPIFVEEADLATVQVLAKPGDPGKKAMTIDGFKIGWSAAFEGKSVYRKQVLLAHLPMLLDSRIRHTLNIGLGSATTLKTLATYPQVETLDCVEISAAVVRASRLFDASSVLEDPRVNLIVDDVIHYMLRSTKKYDVIISDGKQHAFFAGNATLLCQEFYRSALDDLSEDGLFVQWIPIGTLGSDFRIILQTICEVFPQVEVFYYPMDSVLMVGSRRPLAGRPGLELARYMDLPVRDDLSPYSFDHPISVLALWAGSKPQIMQALAGTPISTWDHLRLDFSAFKALPRAWKRSPFDNLNLLVQAKRLPRGTDEATFDLGDTAYLESADLVHRAWDAMFSAKVTDARALAEQATNVNPQDRVARAVLGMMSSVERKATKKPLTR